MYLLVRIWLANAYVYHTYGGMFMFTNTYGDMFTQIYISHMIVCNTDICYSCGGM